MDMLTKRNPTRSAALTVLAPAIRKPFPVEAQRRAHHWGVFKAKDIADAGFICGLPIVVNHGVAHLAHVSG
jgi:hypothetical protein